MKNKAINTIKRIGVFMDHKGVTLLDPDSLQLTNLASGIDHHTRFDGEVSDGTRLGNNRATNNEAHKHNKEQNQAHLFYRKLAGQLKPFDEIFILGPTTAKDEFRNYVHKEKLLGNKKVVTEKSDYLTENQLKEKVIEFFKSE